VQFGVERKRRNLDFVLELFEAGHAAQLNRLRDHPIGPERAIGNSKVEAVTHRPNAANFRRRDVAERTIFFAVQMQASRRDLIQMNFHAASFSKFRSRLQRFPIQD
jgi:predicted RNA methylase